MATTKMNKGITQITKHGQNVLKSALQLTYLPCVAHIHHTLTIV